MLEVKTIKITELKIDKENSIQVPHKDGDGLTEPNTAKLVFKTNQGEKEVAIRVRQWRQVKKGVASVIIELL